MQVLDAIRTRRTIGRLVEPAPDRAALDRAFDAAMAAPDHKRLRPWRFLVIEGDARRQFGTLLAQALQARNPQAGAPELEREGAKALRAPMIIVAVAALKTDGAGVPEIEQMLAAGAATQNLMLALHAQGFGTAWKTGAGAYSDIVRKGLGLGDHDRIVGFIYAGTASAPPPQPAPTGWKDHVADWSGSTVSG